MIGVTALSPILATFFTPDTIGELYRQMIEQGAGLAVFLIIAIVLLATNIAAAPKRQRDELCKHILKEREPPDLHVRSDPILMSVMKSSWGIMFLVPTVRINNRDSRIVVLEPTLDISIEGVESLFGKLCSVIEKDKIRTEILKPVAIKMVRDHFDEAAQALDSFPILTDRISVEFGHPIEGNIAFIIRPDTINQALDEDLKLFDAIVGSPSLRITLKDINSHRSRERSCNCSRTALTDPTKIFEFHSVAIE